MKIELSKTSNKHWFFSCGLRIFPDFRPLSVHCSEQSAYFQVVYLYLVVKSYLHIIAKQKLASSGQKYCAFLIAHSGPPPPPQKKYVRSVLTLLKAYYYDSILIESSLGAEDAGKPCITQRIFPVLHNKLWVFIRLPSFFKPSVTKNFLDQPYTEIVEQRHSYEYCRKYLHYCLQRLVAEFLKINTRLRGWRFDLFGGKECY
jgi:hypothetical protein